MSRRKRQNNTAVNNAMGITLGIFILGYFALRPQIEQSIYQQVIASNGAITYAQASQDLLVNNLVWILAAYVVVAAIIAIIIDPKALKPRYKDQGNADGTFVLSQKVDLSEMGAAQFEQFVASLINRNPIYDAQVVGGAGDKGVDIKIYDKRTSPRQLVGVVQCKCYAAKYPVPPGCVREMVDVKLTHRVNMAFLVTSSYFTRESQMDAEQRGIRLIDGGELRRMMQRNVLQPKAQADHNPPPPAQPYQQFQRPRGYEQYTKPSNGMWDEP